MKKYSFFICCLMLLSLMAACSDDDNNDDWIRGIKGPFSSVTFQKLSDGSYYYDGQCPTEKQLQSSIYGHGWKLEKAHEIGDDGRVKYNITNDNVLSDVLIFDKDGSELFEYHPGENVTKYNAHEAYVTKSGWYSFDSHSGDDRWGGTQIIDYTPEDQSMIVLGPLYLTNSDQPIYGLKFYSKLEDEQTTDIRNGFEEKVPDDVE